MSNGDELSLTVHDDVPKEGGGVVDAGLDASNDAAAPLHEVRPLSCFARLPGGAIVGGGIDRTWGACCELQQIWVQPEYRRQGIARRLLRMFEARAVERGCRTVYLETFSFQAPELYKALGYDTRVAFDGFPGGIVKYVMAREIGGD